ncbi:hypothetical protein SS50377_22778 [Spironucleus salmonicida]|uniref:Uncharacterized protein n=1 Tax=Spironucleus salmonicida TaxID=348837 RepID=V6LYU3_9EUKA|nr:hypothetical protein SS50377_22749 [Spironucleus salmonicida]KAH0575152.1 hypothetical protein SS50377_22778 [Spironucleus salmonicida]|eukprot:EST42289.1 Hypothetical protein SS50377_18157 [Spironucleus salmonicida]
MPLHLRHGSFKPRPKEPIRCAFASRLMSLDNLCVREFSLDEVKEFCLLDGICESSLAPDDPGDQ